MADSNSSRLLTARGQVLYSTSSLFDETGASRSTPDLLGDRRDSRARSTYYSRHPTDPDIVTLRTVGCPPRSSSPGRFDISKLASRENAKRVLGSVFSSSSSNSSSTATTGSSSAELPTRSSLDASQASHGAGVLPASYHPGERRGSPARSVDVMPGVSSIGMSGPSVGRALGSLPGTRGSIGSSSTGDLRRSSATPASRPSISVQPTEDDKPIASANGIACSIRLAEPRVYVTGFEQEGRAQNTQAGTAMIRGTLVLNVTKSIKIKAVTLSFCGKARTEWPEGIPPSKTEYFEEKRLRYQVLPFYNAAYAESDDGYGAQCKYKLRDGTASASSLNLADTARGGASNESTRSSRSSTLLSSKDQKRLSLGSVPARSFQKGDSPYGPTPQQKGYKVFHPGKYEYSFEISLDNTSPETIDLPLGSVHWFLEALVERAGTFKPNLHGSKEILVVRVPDQNSLEQVEPIAISRKWEDQLHYDIVISGKSFPIGSKIPIAFKLTPLAKVQCHRIKVYITENVDYFTEDKKVTRRDAQRKILLLERQAGKPMAKEYGTSDVRILSGGELSPEDREKARKAAQRQREWQAERRHSTAEPLPAVTENLLGDLDLGLDHLVRQTEMEMEVQLPTCEMVRKDKHKAIHPDTSWKLIQVHHWIKIVMRLSRLDTEDPSGTKRRHFEISIDSPFHILSCLATQNHTALPEYSDLNSSTPRHLFECGCPNAAFTDDISPSSSSGSVPTIDSTQFTDPFNSTGPSRSAVPELAVPPQAHLSTNGSSGVQRPIHMLRNPSYNPPAFDAEEPPPPLATPPPGYDVVIGTPSHDGLADYFARLADTYSDDEQTDDEDSNRATSRTGRVNVVNPRTPGGGRAASRSMDINRNFMFRPDELPSRLQQARQAQQAMT